MGTIKLGDKVRDKVSGFEGVVVGSHHYLTGCIRLSVQPATGDDGDYREQQTFDEPQLQIVEASAVTIADPRATGPDAG